MTARLPRTPSFRLDGRRALVTGAGRGLGLALSAALAEAGAVVTLCARTSLDLDCAQAAITAAGGAAESLVLDVRDRSAVRTALEARPAFDILVNNAGGNRPKPFLDVTPEDYEAVMDLNLQAAFWVAQAVAVGMRAAGRGGSLIHVCSQMGHVGGAGRSLYCASKWALEGLNKAIALDLAPYGIRSNTIAPTFIETPMTRSFLADEIFREDVLRRIKLGRLGAPEDLMGAVVFLASDASALMTGTSLIIDGGWTAD
jgi:NAD(P)-dependent dehydrogenase (short-subunit alcohol dehydrogenase family)